MSDQSLAARAKKKAEERFSTSGTGGVPSHLLALANLWEEGYLAAAEPLEKELAEVRAELVMMHRMFPAKWGEKLTNDQIEAVTGKSMAEIDLILADKMMANLAIRCAELNGLLREARSAIVGCRIAGNTCHRAKYDDLLCRIEVALKEPQAT